ncbi:SRPBCC family protein [Ruania zhangjianzhongii]|uniref:SRPBCC family protein n=1 Tax=Ruania zhangjianzhongii TaxID=2603206 RepID=UPI0011C948AA|nr:SRPBCC family protein [Ruania zhangjianzhongii]
MTTFEERDGGFRVVVERHFPHPIEKVWRAVTEPVHLSQWFPAPVELELTPGGAMRFPGFDGAEAVGVVDTVQAPGLLVFTWGSDQFTFTLTAEGDGTQFTLAHVFDDRAGAASFATGWETCIGGLAALIAGTEMPTAEPGFARHEELVSRFGLDRPDVTEDECGWTLRYERQLVCPAQVAWNAWFGTDLVTLQQRRAPAVGEPMTPAQAPEVVLGYVTHAEEPHRLALDLAPDVPGDHLTLEFGEGTGHGARVALTVTGADSGQRSPAEGEWGAGAIGGLAEAGLAWASGDGSV